MSSATALNPAGAVRDLRAELETLATTTWDAIAGEGSRLRLVQVVRSPAAHVAGWFTAIGGSRESATVVAMSGGATPPPFETHGWAVVDRALTRC